MVKRSGIKLVLLHFGLGMLSPWACLGQVVISQIYGGGGNSGAPYRNDFIELFNRGTEPVSLAGWSVQYAGSSSAVWRSTPLAGSIAPGGYYLVQQASGSAIGAELPIADALGDINLSASSGKIALSSNRFTLSGACPTGLVDSVGYGNPNCFAGSGPAPSLSNVSSAHRAANGCADTQDNAADFVLHFPNPRHSGTPAEPCARPPIFRALHEIQGTGPTSALAGQFVVTTTNLVTGLRNNGFFLQAPDSEADQDAGSSEGIFVFTGTALPPVAVIGNAVVVSGIVTEFRPGSNSNSAPRTQINFQSGVLIASGQLLPQAVALASEQLDPAGSPGQLERFEGMRLQIQTLTVCGPTEGFLDERDGVAFSSGVFYGVLAGVPRPFREPGILVSEPLPSEAPCCLPRFDGNPERLRIDGNAQPGTFSREVTAGTLISNLVGVLDFEAGDYTLLPEAAAPYGVSGLRTGAPVPPAATNEFTIASLNCRRLFDSVDDPLTDDPVVAEAAFRRRLAKLSLAIRTVLLAPDILALLEVENQTVLQAIADQVNADAMASGSDDPAYQAWLFEGNDPGGINTGFLVRSARVAVRQVWQADKSATYRNPISGQLDLLYDRPPLVLRAALARPDSIHPLPCTVVANHLRSLRGIDDPADGARVRAKRRAQAETLARFIQSLQSTNPAEALFLIGDYNAYQFNDGYVDVIGTIQGSPAPSNQVLLASADLVEPNLIDLTGILPASERYSYVIGGNAQTLDHVLVNSVARARVQQFLMARFNADFPETFANNAARPERVSDHDTPVVYVTLAARPPRITSLEQVALDYWRIEFAAEPDGVYSIEASRDLETWENIGPPTWLQGERFEFNDRSSALSARRFYRIAEQELQE